MKKIIIMLILISLSLPGCSGMQTGKDAGDSKKDGSGIIAENEDFEKYDNPENLEVAIVEGEVERGAVLDRTIGKASFAPQNEDKVEFDYYPDQQNQSISVTDANGWEWTFSFPQYALTRYTQIIFTPLSRVQLDSLPGAEISGFLVEPDGLTFLAPPTVTIKKRGETAGGFLLSSAHDGSGVTISPASLSKDGLQGSIPHFSAWYLLPESDSNDASMEQVRKFATQQCEAAVKAAKELLKKPITVPVPPSISWECLNDEKSEQAKAYADLVNQEEDAMLTSLLAAMKMEQLAGGDADFELARRVAARGMAKIDKLFKTYNGQPDKLLAVFRATGTIFTQYSLLGGETPDLGYYLPWVQKTRKYYMDRLVKQHEYRAAGAVAELSRFAILLGGEADLQEWLDALKFKLKIKIAFTQEYGDEYGILTSEGEGEMVPQIVSTKDLWKSNNVFLKGDIKIKTERSGFYKEYELTPTGYTISAEVRNWDPCKTQSCDIWVSTLGLEEEKLGFYMDGEFEVFSEVLIWDYAWDNFEAELNKGFHVKLNNLGESAVIQTFSGTDEIFGGVTLDVLFDLVHTPK